MLFDVLPVLSVSRLLQWVNPMGNKILPRKRVLWCGGRGSNPRRPTPVGPKPTSFDHSDTPAPRPRLTVSGRGILNLLVGCCSQPASSVWLRAGFLKRNAGLCLSRFDGQPSNYQPNYCGGKTSEQPEIKHHRVFWIGRFLSSERKNDLSVVCLLLNSMVDVYV